MSYGSCNVCGIEMERDPASEVDCPTCDSKAGEKCKRPSGHTVWGGYHQVRIKRGVKAVCPEQGQPCWDDEPEGEGEDPDREQATLT